MEQQQTKNEIKKASFSSFLTQPAIKAKINEVMGGEAGNRFLTQILSAVVSRTDLQLCDPMSILNCALIGESLKLSSSTQLGQYYIIPYKDRATGKTVATFQLGYKGYIQLAIRSGYYRKLNISAIKKGEILKCDQIEDVYEFSIIQDFSVREQTETIGYYATFEYTNGFKKSMYWSKEKMNGHALRYSQTYRADKAGNSFWGKDFDGMALKTLLRQIISKWGIMSVELQVAFEKDMTTNVNGKDVYFDNGGEKDFQIDERPKEEKERKEEKTEGSLL